MHAIDSTGSVAGNFVDKNPATGARGTNLAATWFNDTQANLLAVLAEGNIVPTKGRAADLTEAIKAIVGGITGTGDGAPTTLLLTAEGLVKGGGDLTQNRSFTVEAATAAEITAGIVDDKAITPAALRQAGDANVLGDGYTRLPGGVILQWGSVRGDYAESSIRINFAIRFPNACFAVAPVAVNQTGGDTYDIWAQIVGRDQDGFTNKFQFGGGGASNSIDGLDYFAIGF